MLSVDEINKLELENASLKEELEELKQIVKKVHKLTKNGGNKCTTKTMK